MLVCSCGGWPGKLSSHTSSQLWPCSHRRVHASASDGSRVRQPWRVQVLELIMEHARGSMHVSSAEKTTAPHALRPVTEPREARAAAVTVKPLADCSFRSFPPRHLARRSTVREGATLKPAQFCQSQFHAGPEGGAPLATPQFCQIQGLPQVSRVVSMTTPQFCASSASSPTSLTNSHQCFTPLRDCFHAFAARSLRRRPHHTSCTYGQGHLHLHEAC